MSSDDYFAMLNHSKPKFSNKLPITDWSKSIQVKLVNVFENLVRPGQARPKDCFHFLTSRIQVPDFGHS